MFATKQLTEKSGRVTLVGQLRFGATFCLLPVVEGMNVIEITVHSGKIRMNHCAYNPDGGTWLSDPTGDPTPHINMEESDVKHFEIRIGRSYKKLDILQVVNRSFINPAVFEYSIT